MPTEPEKAKRLRRFNYVRQSLNEHRTNINNGRTSQGQTILWILLDRTPPTRTTPTPPIRKNKRKGEQDVPAPTHIIHRLSVQPIARLGSPWNRIRGSEMAGKGGTMPPEMERKRKKKKGKRRIKDPSWSRISLVVVVVVAFLQY